MSLEPWGQVVKEGFLEKLYGAAQTCWGAGQSLAAEPGSRVRLRLGEGTALLLLPTPGTRWLSRDLRARGTGCADGRLATLLGQVLVSV